MIEDSKEINQYVRGRTTWFDEFLTWSFLAVPAGLIFLGVDLFALSLQSEGMYERLFWPTVRPYGLVLGPVTVLCVLAQWWRMARKQKYLNDYFDSKK